MVQVGAHARLMSQALRKINVNAAKAGTTIIFLNQLRSKVGRHHGSPEVTTGERAQVLLERSSRHSTQGSHQG